jgi:sterol desaturase/sphingolipid hydroxylase (fatty acid hydroxylase superfamily)
MWMFITVTLAVLNLAWIIPHVCYYVIYHIQHPLFEQYSLQVWPWESAAAEAAAAAGVTPVPPTPEPVPSAFGVRSITKARKTAAAYYAQVVHGAKWVFKEHVYQSSVTAAAMYFLLRKIPDATLHAYVDATPGVATRSFQMFIGLLLFETAFYFGHRALHHPSLYKYHKDHHSFYTTVVLSGKLFHPVDVFFSSTFPGLLPFVVFWSDFHIYTFWVWSTMHIFHSAYIHSGYDFPYNPFMVIPYGSHGEHHNFHHSHNVDCFGAFWYCWDRWLGTDKAWRAHEAEQLTALAAQDKAAAKTKTKTKAE